MRLSDLSVCFYRSNWGSKVFSKDPVYVFFDVGLRFNSLCDMCFGGIIIKSVDN